MNILDKLTIRNLKLNKKRTLVTIVGIILSTAMICAVAGMVTSFQKSLEDSTIRTDGNYHITFKDVPKEELKYIQNNRDIKDSFLTYKLGYANLEGSKNDAKPYIFVYGYDKKALNNYAVNLLEGRLPKNSNEIIVSEHTIKNGKVLYKVGETITLDIGTRKTTDGYVLTQNNPYKETNKENIYDTSTKQYTIVGIMKRPNNNIEPYSAPGYTMITLLDDNFVGNANVSVLFNDPNAYEEVTNSINGSIIDGTYATTLNKDLLRWQGAAWGESIMSALITVASIVIIIIIVSSVFVIKNSFSISITERYKQYGMLASIGATSKQIRKNVVFEGIVLGLIAIPIGILSGIFATAVLLWLVNVILGNWLHEYRFIYSVPLLPIVISAVLAYVTIYLSALLPARKAAKISPIEAIRSNNDIKIKGKKLKTPIFVKKLFNIGGTLAYKNLKRNKKKYRTTVISLVVSIVIFIALSSFIDFGFKISNIAYHNVDYQIAIGNEEEDATQSYNTLMEFTKLDNIDYYSVHQSAYLMVDMDKYGNDIDNPRYAVTEQGLTIVCLNEEAYKRYVKKIGGNYEKYKNGAIIIDDVILMKEGKRYETQVYSVKEGENIIGYESNTENQISIPIVKRTSQKPMGLEDVNSDFLIVSPEIFKHFTNIQTDGLYINSSDTDKLCKNIDSFIKANSLETSINYYNLDEDVKQKNALVLVISIFLYGFITVITLIGVTNIFNTITTNMKLRSKEFAMLKAVGMTNDEFNKMIKFESLFFGFKSLIIGIPIGIAFSYWIYLGFNNAVETKYQLPLLSICISVAFVFAIIGLIMKYSLHKINKQNIIETIREENI